MRTFGKSSKLDNVLYDVRGPVVDEAARMEEDGMEILKLNIGNPYPFGFSAPQEVILDMLSNVRTSQGYSDSKGIFSARKAIMQYAQLRGIPGVTINDIYTGMDFTKENYYKLGVLSIDHFIPWSFVLHDEMWNLTPTFNNINSSKSDNLPSYQEYIDKFCSVQYEAFSYLCDKKKDKDLECYIDVMRLENPFEFLKYKSREEFNDKLKQTISPIYQIALNQGFEVLNKVY